MQCNSLCLIFLVHKCFTHTLKIQFQTKTVLFLNFMLSLTENEPVLVFVGLLKTFSRFVITTFFFFCQINLNN